ncbi:MAG: hypothetical protein FWD02_00745 [Bacteroidales bacterium]|nr:hypothetical protein [Bacteroidales bacterium]
MFGGYKKIVLIACLIAISAQIKAEHTFQVFDRVLFFNGFRSLEDVADEITPLPEGFYRLSTADITTRLTEEQLSLLSGSIRLDVVVSPSCDNFDRLGHVKLVLVPKKSDSIRPVGTKSIEIARFITPFMDRHREPSYVPYTFQVNYLQHIFQDKNLRENFDFWLELRLFGVPYRAWQQIEGCYGRNCTFYGSISFTTMPAPNHELETCNVFIPLFTRVGFRNFVEGDTDTLGQTIRSIVFTVPEDLTDAQLVLITSNHGANRGGEEYIRRWHFVYLNGEEILRYRPGGLSCESFRVFNTQFNRIYHAEPLPIEYWEPWNNWCPGDVIPTRIINLGAMLAGKYKFTINVPEAEFVDQQGDFPLSLFFQGKTSGQINR